MKDQLRELLAAVTFGDSVESPGAILGYDWADAIIDQAGDDIVSIVKGACEVCGKNCAVCGANLSQIEAWAGDVCLLCGGEDSLCRTPLTGPPNRPRPPIIKSRIPSCD